MEEILNFLSFITTITSFIGAMYSAFIWTSLQRKEKFSEQRIKIQLKMPQLLVELPYAIERKYLTRSELQGLLGILPIKEGNGRKATDRYQLSFLNTPAFFANLKSAQGDKDTTFVEIICQEDELQQFDLDKIRQQCRVTYIG